MENNLSTDTTTATMKTHDNDVDINSNTDKCTDSTIQGSYDYAKSFIFPDMSPAPAANMEIMAKIIASRGKQKRNI